MNLQPIIKAKLSKFRDDFDLTTLQEGALFERFSNQIILSAHQPGAFSSDGSLLDSVCVGGPNDMGLDGVCIKLNGILVHSINEAKDVITLHRRADIEFLFIQSKYKEKYDTGEYSKFINGVSDFLGEDHYQPHNDEVDSWIMIKEYLLSDEVMIRWDHSPSIHLYYVVMGKWEENAHILAISEKFKKEIEQLNVYGKVQISYVDAAHFKRLCDENENNLNVVINVVDTFSLTEVNEVDNSNIILCSAAELLKLLVSEDGLMRRSLFDDNVRDFQGDTTINSEILDTIKNVPQSFVLLNNGITIVCDEIIPGNRKVTVRNPQIVNGCQTCNVIFLAAQKGIDLSNISLIAKIIATRSDLIINNIVKGTNRQNIVYDEAFEITRPFHKDLESLFAALSSENHLGLYYERRSKQFNNNPIIKPVQRVNLRIILQSFIGIFLNEPYNAHRHESKLLQDYKNKIFIETQSKYPYYVAPAIYMEIEKRFRTNDISKTLSPYKMHIAWIFKELSAEGSASINNEKEIDAYCSTIMAKLLNTAECQRLVESACNFFQFVSTSWVAEKGETYRFGIKDSSDFFNFMKSELEKELSYESIDEQESELSCRGKVLKVKKDKNGQFYGYISRDPVQIFFHSKDNPSLDFQNILGREVLYIPVTSDQTGSEKAYGVELV